VADLLARAGVGTLRLVDRDVVESGNLQGQCLFEEEDATQLLPKAEAAARQILSGRKDAISRQLVHFELWHGDVTMLSAAKVPDCPVCGQGRFELLERGDLFGKGQ